MEFTKEQEQAIQAGRVVTLNVGGADCIVWRKDVFDRGEALDYSPWSSEEMDLLAAEAAEISAGDGLTRWTNYESNAWRCIEARFPHAAGGRGKKRPVVIVQGDVYNQRLRHAVVAEITANLAEKSDPAFLFIQAGTPQVMLLGLIAIV